MSSLFSAINFLSGLKEYTYRGFQQLPLVLMGVSFLFTATTGSIAFLNMLVGLVFVIPAVTYLLNKMFGFVGSRYPSFNYTFSHSDVCGLVPPEGKSLSLYTSTTSGVSPIPSYWLMEVMFFFGFLFANVGETYTASGNCPESDAAERRKYHATYVLATLLVLFFIIMFMRFRYMPSCEMTSIVYRGGPAEIAISVLKILLVLVLTGGIAGGIGVGMYQFARACGARSGDLLGILSQFLPPNAYATAPVVCTSE